MRRRYRKNKEEKPCSQILGVISSQEGSEEVRTRLEIDGRDRLLGYSQDGLSSFMNYVPQENPSRPILGFQ